MKRLFCVALTFAALCLVGGEADTWVIGAVADNRGGNQFHLAVMESITRDKPEIILNLGDMIYPGEGKDWSAFLADFKKVYGADTDAMLQKYFVCVGGWEERVFNRARRLADPPVSKEEWAKQQYASPHDKAGYEPDNAAGQAFYDEYFKYKERAGKPGSPILDYDEFGDYHATHHGMHLLSIYLTDEWGEDKKYFPGDDVNFRKQAWDKQAHWLEKRLSEIRKSAPDAPVIVLGHKATWLKPGEGPFFKRLNEIMAAHRVDLALCGDGHKYVNYSDAGTLKFMVPATLNAAQNGYMRITLTKSTITVEHCNDKGDALHSFKKKIGKPVKQ